MRRRTGRKKVDLEVAVFIDREATDQDPIELEITAAEIEDGTIWVYVLMPEET